MKKIFDKSFIRFLFVGVFNTIIGYGLMFVMYNYLILGYWPSTALSNLVGAIISFFLNRNFTFKSKASVKKSFIKFMLIVTVCYIISYSLSKLIIPPLISTAFGTMNIKVVDNISMLFGMCAYTLCNYLGQKFFVFMK